MKSIYLHLSIVCSILVGYNLSAQSNQELSPAFQKEFIEELSQLIDEEYILEDIGSEMTVKLGQLSENANEVMMSDQFLALINKELHSVYMDKHLGVINPEKFKQVKKMFGLEKNGHHGGNNSHHKSPEKHGNEHKQGGHHDSHHSSNLRSAFAGSRVINRDGRTEIGFLNVTQFDGSDKGLSEFQQIFTSFSGVDAVIIDLRKCKGGDADMVKALSGSFFEKETYLVSTIGRKDVTGHREEKQRWTVVNEFSKEFKNVPVYIMTSKQTFSAAESFTFGLKLTNRAIVVGENTGGGGHMNTFFELPGGYGVSISVGRTFDGKTGKGFQGTGVEADIPVEADHAFAKTLELIKQKRTTELAYSPSKEKVHQTLQQLSDAWYTGNVKSAEPLFFDKCNTHIKTGNQEIVKEVNLLDLIEKGFGTKTPREFRNREISIYEVRDNKTAIARLMLRDQIHYLHLINDNDSWKIISDLITMKERHG